MKMKKKGSYDQNNIFIKLSLSFLLFRKNDEVTEIQHRLVRNHFKHSKDIQIDIPGQNLLD
jgi:hypothetical protein